jgi:hypothetical protein
MTINRRLFFSLLVARPRQSTSLRVAVLEAFGARETVRAVLVHHAEADTRDLFARWLQSHPSTAVGVVTPAGENASATIFRVRMCFGRGLIVFETPMRVRERDILRIVL